MPSVQLLEPIIEFLSNVTAMNQLPRTALEAMAKQTRIDYVGRDTKILVQGETPIEYISIIAEGAVELYYETEEDHETDVLDEYGLYGGLSLLRNDGISLRSGRTVEDTFLYLVPSSVFLEICVVYPAFRNFFYDRLKTSYHRSIQAMRRYRMRIRDDGEDHLYHVTVGDIINKQVTLCEPDCSIRRAAQIMTEAQTGYIVVRGDSLDQHGIITDSDLRRNVVARGFDSLSAVRHLMQSPLITVDAQSTVLEALLAMIKHGIAYLPIIDENQQVTGVISGLDLPQVQRKSPLSLIHQASQAQSLEEVEAVKGRLPEVVGNLFQEGYSIDHMTRYIADVSDSVAQRAIAFALERLGKPPCEFAFVTLGSEGRDEQTLLVDQDNGIVYADNEDAAAAPYFANLGALICTSLDRAGYCYCNGQVMASNPQWCQSVSVWKDTFKGWIKEPVPMSIMYGQIFFDMRCVYGSTQLVDELFEHLFEQLSRRSDLYFRNMALRHLDDKPPLGFFRNFAVASHGKHKQTFDVKKVMNFVVDFARLFSLKNGIRPTNTLRRLMALKETGVLTQDEFEDIKRGYHYMMSLRLSHQEELISEGEEPNNFINPYKLNKLDQEILKAVFRVIRQLQGKVRMAFVGPDG